MANMLEIFLAVHFDVFFTILQAHTRLEYVAEERPIVFKVEIPNYAVLEKEKIAYTKVRN